MRFFMRNGNRRGFRKSAKTDFTEPYTGVSPSGKAQDFDSCIRWSESSYPCQQKRHPCGAFFVGLRVHGGGLQKRKTKAEKHTVVRALSLTGALPSRFCVEGWKTILPTGITATPAKNLPGRSLGRFLLITSSLFTFHSSLIPSGRFLAK